MQQEQEEQETRLSSIFEPGCPMPFRSLSLVADAGSELESLIEELNERPKVRAFHTLKADMRLTS